MKKKITTIDETLSLIEKYEVAFKIGKITEEDKRYSILGALHDLYEQGLRDSKVAADDTSDAQNVTHPTPTQLKGNPQEKH